MADHNTPQAVAERIKEWIGSYGGENTATLLLYEAMNALKATPAAAVADAQPIELQGVAETVADGGGFWRSCSGCHVADEGVPAGPMSEALGCNLGNGCAECGGIGAVWATLDYQAMADEMAASMNTVPDDLDEGVQAIVTLLEGREWADLLPHRNPLVMRLWDAITALHEEDQPAEPSDISGELAAAAPELLAAVERQYVELADYRNSWAGRNTIAGQTKLCQLRDLIAKAAGRTERDVQDDYGTRAAIAASKEGAAS